MGKKQKIIIISIISIVLALLTVGNLLASNRNRVKENPEKEKKTIVEKIEGDELLEDVEADDIEELDVLDDSQAVSMKTTANVNLRKESNTDSEIIKVISKGTEL